MRIKVKKKQFLLRQREMDLQAIMFFVILQTTDLALGANVARGKPTKQNSNYLHNGVQLTSDKAVDGITSDSPTYCAHTAINTETFWWGVNLEQEYSIQKIYIHGSGAASRRHGYQIYTYRSGEATLNNMPISSNCLCYHGKDSPQYLTLACQTHRKAKIIQIYRKKYATTDALTLCEVEVFSEQRGNENRKFGYCRQINKDGHFLIDSYRLGFSRRIECSNLCSEFENCLGFKIDATGKCNLYQTSTVTGNGDSWYYEHC